MKRTSNGGVNWVLQSSGTSNTIYSVFFAAGPNGWIGGGSGNIRKSVDYGVNWSAQTSQSSQINSVFFLNTLQGYMVGQNGLIRTTANGGSTWTAQTSGLSAEFKDVHFINTTTGWIVGLNGNIIKTTNSGATWQNDITGVTAGFWSVHFPSTSAGYAVGAGGMIQKCNPTVGVNMISTELPQEFKLYNSYPNPFNPSTTIKFDIAGLTKVKIAVFDVLGKEIQTLVNDNLKSGKYELQFDATGLSSGMYFYTMEAGDYKSIKKMVLVK